MGTLNGTEANNILTVSTYDYMWTVNGYGGDDTITINTYIPAIVINGGAGHDLITVRSGETFVIHGDAGNDEINILGSSSTGSRSIYGDVGNDKITGSGEAEFIYGGADNDRLYGYQGVDHLYGDGGNDILVATLTSQAVFYDGGADFDTLRIEASSSYFWYEPNIASLSGIEKIENTDPIKPAYLVGSGLNLAGIELVDIVGVKGNSGNNYLMAGNSKKADGQIIEMEIQGLVGNDSLRGAENVDVLKGGDGNDRLDGFAGNDELYGGAGNDQFHFYQGWDVDTIEDFTQGEDFIYIHATGLYDISSMTTSVDENSNLIVNIGPIEFHIANGAALTLTNADFVFTQTIPYS
ncbi:calcium-binding protein [Xanthobacter sediminis]